MVRKARAFTVRYHTATPCMRPIRASVLLGLIAGLLMGGGSVAIGQTQTPPPAGAPPVKASRVYGEKPPPVTPARIERLSDTRLRVGAVQVDLARKEVSVRGVINAVPLIEFVVNTKDGYKSYESAIEADSNAIDFNLALILIGLDRSRATTRPRFHFDPVPPDGDPVEVWVSWRAGAEEKRVPADELIYDDGAKRPLPPGRWVYTGSQFMPRSRAFLADVDGVLIGFVHTPAPLIERVDAVPGPFGAVMLNPTLDLKPGTEVTVTVRALPLPKK